MKSICAIACLLIIVQGARAQQVDCGPNPELNVSWSNNFKLATLHTACSASSTSAEGIGDGFAFAGGQDTSSCNKDTLSDEQASKYMQAEIVNQRAAIVAACGYYACKISGTTASVANIAALSDVCGLALEPGGSTPIRSAKDFKVIPAFMPRVITTPSQNVRVFVENLSNGILTFDRPSAFDSGAVVISPTSNQFSVKAHSGQWLTVKLVRPVGQDLPQEVSLPLSVHGSVEDQQTVRFSVGRSATDFLPPVSLGCGRLNPHMAATAYSDVPPGHGFDPKTFDVSAFAGVPDGQKDNFESDFSEYHNNGGGQISIRMDSSCTQLDSTRDHATVILSFSTTTTALSGHCCSGFGPGGDGTTNPEWLTDFVLPGTGKQRWDISVISSTKMLGPSPICKIRLDGVENPLDVNVQRTNRYAVTAGKHQVGITCTEGRIGSRPGNWNFTNTANEALNITLDAHLR